MTAPLEDESPRQARLRRLQAAEDLAREQEGIIGRRQAYALGVTRWQVSAQLKARRWHRRGSQTLSITTGPLTPRARMWVAVVETCPAAAIDGVHALVLAGLRGVDELLIDVIVPKSSDPRRSRGTRVHESRRFCEGDILTNGIRRVRPPVAVVHAALWAVSDRQAALYVVAAVQQRIVRVADVQQALTAVRRHRRRRLLVAVLADCADGTHSLNELDFTRAARRRGLPTPSRQLVVQLAGGRAYLDVGWEEYDVFLEIDGEQHEEVAAKLADVLRDLDVAATGRTTLRLPILALRVDEAAVLAGVAQLLRARGWQPPGEAVAA